MCHFCDVTHPIDHMTRHKVILSTSTLSGTQYMEGWGWEDNEPHRIHVDMETIPGARISTLRKAWERAYAGNPLPIDTVMVAGLNDVIQLVKHYGNQHDMEQIDELVSNDIMADITAFHSTMVQHSQRYDVDDTLAVSLILHVPMLYWHEDDGELPTPDYINYKSVVDRTNLKIEAFNIEHGSSKAPKYLHLAGERGLSRNRKIYMWQAWREANKEDKLHLKDPHRIKIVKMLCKYFTTVTAKTYQHLY